MEILMVGRASPIGRDDELESVLRFLDRVQALPGALVLEGEAGAGKTTLFDAAVGAALERGYRVLVCRPAESERTLSLAALRDLVELVFVEVADELRPAARTALAVALLREEPARPPSPEGVASGFLDVVRSLAARGPLLVGIDDAHWLDPESERVVSFASRRLRDAPVALLVSTRTGRPDRLVSILERGLGSEHVFRLAVGPLSLGAIHRLLHERLGITLSRPAVRRVHEASGGNPFFALEIARVADPGPASRLAEPLRLSPQLEDLIEERLARLPRSARSLLPVVASMPRPTRRALHAFLGPAEADRLLGQAEHAGVLVLDEARIRFTHPLLAAHAYGQLTASERMILHSRLAETTSDLEERARHLALAADGPDESVARALEAAARDAAARGAPAAAADLLETAAALTPADLDEQRFGRLIEAARARFVAGESREAAKRLTGLLPELPAGTLRAEALAVLGRISYYIDDHVAARRHYEGALAQPGIAAEVAREAHDGLAWLLSREDTRAAAGHAREAVRLARSTGDEHALAEALATQGQVANLLGEAAAADLIARGIQMAAGRDYERVVQDPAFAQALTLVWRDDLQGGLEVFERLLSRALERQDEASSVRILLGLAFVHLLRGDWDEADRCAAEGAEAARLSGQHPQLKVLFCSKSLVDAHRGRVEEVRAQAWSEADPFGDIAGGVERIANGFLELSLDHPEEARRVLAPLVERVLASGIREPGAVRFVPDYVEALIRLGRLDEAEDTLRWYEEAAAATGRSSAMSAAGRCRGLLLSARGDFSGVARRLRRGAPGARRGPDALRAGQGSARGRRDAAACEEEAVCARDDRHGGPDLRAARCPAVDQPRRG
jgi:tetratricopeptide (TPR) repeat protein